MTPLDTRGQGPTSSCFREKMPCPEMPGVSNSLRHREVCTLRHSRCRPDSRRATRQWRASWKYLNEVGCSPPVTPSGRIWDREGPRSSHLSCFLRLCVPKGSSPPYPFPSSGIKICRSMNGSFLYMSWNSVRGRSGRPLLAGVSHLRPPQHTLSPAAPLVLSSSRLLSAAPHDSPRSSEKWMGGETRLI